MPPRSRGPIASEFSLKIILGPSQSSFVCHGCRASLAISSGRTRASLKPPFRSYQSSQSHPFSTATRNLSKKSKGGSKHPPSAPNNAAQKNRDQETDPYDYSELETGIATAISRLKDALAKTRHAGRVSAEMLESLPVTLPTRTDPKSPPPPPRKDPKLHLSDIATVVPKGGRTLQIFLTDAAHLAPVKSAVQSSPHSLTPTTDPNNTMLLLVNVPPATAETREQAKTEAKKMLERANLEIRTARGDAQKRFRRMELEKLVIKDELRKAHDGMEKVVKKGVEEAKGVYEGAVKSLER